LNPRIVAILVVLLVVLGGGALLYQRQEAARRPSNAATLGQILLKDLKAADIASIRITEGKSALTLARKDERWTLAELGGFPADFTKVRDFVIKAIELKAGQSEPISDKDRGRLKLDESGTNVEFRGADGKPLRSLVVGKKYFKREVENPDKAIGDGRFVQLPSEPAIVYIVGDPLIQATTKTADWIDRSAFQVEKVKTLDVKFADEKGSYHIERNGDNADWKLAGLKAGEKLDVSRANAASYSLGLLDLADAQTKEAAKDTGLDKPIEIKAVTLDGLIYDIKVGKLQGENYFVTFTSSGTVKADPKDAERTKKLAERQAREKLLQNYVLLIPKNRLEDTLKKRPAFLEKKEDRKK
jgi:hypothetical protein